jgi:hypothetical protein
VISLSGSLLTSTPASTYQWYFNGSIISGANSQNYTALSAGNYYVEVTYFNGCPYLSNTINVFATNVLSTEAVEEFSIFPNPVSDILTIISSAGSSGLITIRLSNLIGEIVFQHSYFGTGIQNQTQTLSLSDFNSGVYFIEISSTERKYLKKIIKQ